MPSPNPSAIDDDAILALVTRLARPDGTGGQVIERAAIMAAGAGSGAVEAWILAHAGKPEEGAATTAGRGLHGDRFIGASRQRAAPRRYVIPPGVL